jgi:hypothetical protein
VSQFAIGLTGALAAMTVAERTDQLRMLGSVLRPYSGEAADYLESYEEDR